MKLLFDLFPLLLFFGAYKFADLYVATGVAMAASVVQILWLVARRKKIEPMHWINLTIIVVFGGATLFLHNELFIKWKPTVLYWLFAVVLLGGQWIAKKNLMRSMLGAQIQLPDAIWNRLNTAWALFFAVVGCVNLYVAYNWPTETWVTFKVFGIFGLLLAFVIIQSIYLGRHMKTPVKDGAAKVIKAETDAGAERS
ncbi:putative intracellular septation protein A [Pigmentiphaga litoralis]|jgi:intracellular septation protein|uniref:septation protein A n=1 Tax=Pigmentiphaga litoralis TaxID=516702 RepID=UPI001675AD73|nr:septation protein A [Pigmentiphaga litoralis]GGX01175.1 putative intracellular septation protein A [Pigmentiphaga litoralis]